MLPQKRGAKLFVPDIKDVKPVFDAIDTDKSGGIDVPELEQAMKKIGLSASREQVKAIIELMDDNHNGVMDIEEFRRFMFVIKNADPENLASLLFFVSDIDYSGRIDAKELSIVLGKLGLEVQTEEARKLIEMFGDAEEGELNYAQFMQLIGQLTE